MTEFIHQPISKEEMESMRQMAAEDEQGLLKKVWDKITSISRKLPFAEDVLAMYFCVQDASTPRKVKLVLLGALAYFLLPVDALPDFLPLLGFTDDAAVIAAAIASVANSITQAHRDSAKKALGR